MQESEILAIIKNLAYQHDVPWELVAGVCKAESAMNPWAMRYEPSYRWLVGNESTLNATERTGQMISWGLMQVMGAVAREHGYIGWLPKLCDPTIGLQYGILHLTKFHKRYGAWPDAIASYNAGSPKRTEAGKYFNQGYVDKVTLFWRGYELPLSV